MFTRNAALLATSMPQEAVKKLIVPLLVRAADQGIPFELHVLIIIKCKRSSLACDCSQTSCAYAEEAEEERKWNDA